MKKPQPNNIKLSNTPIKSPSPDMYAGNRITSTKNIKKNQYTNPSYYQQSYEYRPARTPTKISQTPKNQGSTSHKYFTNNRSTIHHTKNPQERSRKIFNKSMNSELSNEHHSHCHDAGYEINSQLKKLLSMISSSGLVSEFHYHSDREYSPQKQKIKSQISCIEKENRRLIGLLNDLEQRQVHTPCPHSLKASQLQQQVSVLRSQLSKATQRCDKEYQSLYDSKQQITSELIAIRDRNSYLQKQTDSLRYLLKQKQDQIFRIEQQLKRQNDHDKLSLIKIKDQYNQSFKALRTNLSAQIQVKNESNQHKVIDLNKRINHLQQRIRSSEYKLKNGTVFNKDQQKQLQYYKSQFSIIESNFKNSEKQVRSLREQRKGLEGQIAYLNNKLKQASSNRDHETELKIRSLMENYDKEISLLKRDYDSVNSKKQSLELQLERINSELVYQKRISQQELQKLESQLYTLRLQSNMKADIEHLNRQNQRLNQQISRLKDHIFQLQETQRQLVNQIHHLKTSAISVHQITSLRNKNNQLSNDISQRIREITNLQSENQNLLHQHNELSNRLEEISNAYERLKKNINSQQINNQTVIQEKNRKIHELQLTINNITQILAEMEQKVNILEQSKIKFSEQYQANQKLRLRIVALQAQLRDLRVSHQSQINQLRISIYNQAQRGVRQEIQKQLTMKILTEREHYSKNIKNELIQLKSMVNEGKFDNIEKQLVRISQLYNRQIVNSEKQKQQIERLLRIQVQTDDRKNQLEKLNIALEEKNRILESNLKLVQRQLRQRKQMYEQLLSQKSLLEKEITSLKRVGIDSEIVKTTRLRAMQISSKIDKLLTMQEEIGKSVLTYTTSTYMINDGDSKKKRK